MRRSLFGRQPLGPAPWTPSRGPRQQFGGLVQCEYSNELIAEAQVMEPRGPERTN